MCGGGDVAWRAAGRPRARLVANAARPRASTPPLQADIVLRGYSGYNTEWALQVAPSVLPPKGTPGAPAPPAAVVVAFGANDAALPDRGSARQHVPVARYGENVRALVAAARAAGAATVVVVAPPPVDDAARVVNATSKYGAPADRPPDRTLEASGRYAEAAVGAATAAGATAIHAWRLFQDARTDWAAALLSDGLHLTPAGNEVVAGAVLGALRAAGLDPDSLGWDVPAHEAYDECPR